MSVRIRYKERIVSLILRRNNLKELIISNITLYSAMRCRHIPRYHNVKDDAASIGTISYISLCCTMRCTHIPRYHSVKDDAALIGIWSSTKFFGIVSITSSVNLCFSASSTSANLRCSASCYHTTISVFSELVKTTAVKTHHKEQMLLAPILH